ncbi:hypothetical protein ATCC90586_011837 [Pythium insidiosum]|nr:hypothetical protein ATCC90586_011837 [Pythium insidiosum]
MRARSNGDHKFTDEHRQWLYNFYTSRPLAYLDEAQNAFEEFFNIEISIKSVWRIIHDLGFTRKVLERRAINIKEQDVTRFLDELSRVDWVHQNLVFLDEVSFDNRGMIRRRGYALRGQKLAIRGEFQRKPRVSILAFLGVNGVIDYYDTEGTFDRLEFVRCCQQFAYSECAALGMYPGKNSVWILDGAAIHRHPEIVNYLRALGIVPIFLPAYCPFFNPIEFMFGYIKKAFLRYYEENRSRDLLPFVASIFNRFEEFDMSKVFTHCGWAVNGVFNPVGPLSTENRPAPIAWRQGDELEDEESVLAYRERDDPMSD